MDREQLKKDLKFIAEGMKQEARSIGRITAAVWVAVLVMMAIFNIIEVIGGLQ
jgi:hypothetical protein